jgi:hypothetical protein
MTSSKFLMGVMLSMSSWMLAAPASADWNGTACWTLGGADSIQLDYSVGPTGQVQVVGKWVACGLPPNRYFLPVTGAISSNGPGSYRMGLHATVVSGTCYPDPADPVDVALDATFTSPTFGGTWQLQCGSFKNSGTLTLIPCPIPQCVNGASGPAALR